MALPMTLSRRLLIGKKGNASLFGLLAIGGIAVGFGIGYFVASKKKISSADRQEEVVAIFNGTGVTAQDAYTVIKNRIYETEGVLYEMKRRAIMDHIQSRLLEEESKKTKLSIAALLAKNVGTEVKEPSEKEIGDYLVSRGLNPKDKRVKKEDVRNYLKYRAQTEKRQAYLEKLADEANIKLLIAEPMENKVALALEGYATWGNSNAPVTVVEYTDFPCATCARNTENIDKLKKEFGPEKIKIVFAENPTPSNPRAYPAANAARCANEQGRFWEMRDLLFQNPNKLEDKNLKEYAQSLGLDSQKFNACVEKKTFTSQIEKSKQQAVKQGILALPSLIVNGTLIQGNQPFEKIKQKVEAELKPRG